MSKQRVVRRQSVSPKNINGQVTARTAFWRNELRKVVKGMFELKCPDYWDTEYFLNTLIDYGFILISDSVAGILPFWCSLTGINYTQAPTKAIVAVPNIREFKRTLSKDAALIYLERMYGTRYYTFRQLIDVYAEQLASADCSVDVNLINSRLGYIAEAETKAQADAIKEAYDRISLGEPLVVHKGSTLTQGNGLQLLFGNVKNNYIADVILDTKRTIICEFLTRIGINNANTDKKERLIVDEANSNNIELMANTTLWKYNLERSEDMVHKLFPDLEYSLKLRFDTSNLLKGGTIDDLSGRNPDMGNKESG